MNRKTFISKCGSACLSLSIPGILLSGCSPAKILDAEIIGSDLTVPLSEFQTMKDGETQFRKFVIAYNPRLEYPLCIFRFDAQNYSAVLMRCTHQGVELQAFGDKLQCPGHGSEFDNKGIVQNGPAEANLRTFAVRLENKTLKISLQ